MIRKMKSIPELHRWVISKTSASVAGDLSTFAKLCQRLDLKLAAPGRPSKVA